MKVAEFSSLKAAAPSDLHRAGVPKRVLTQTLKPTIILLILTAGLKPCPFKTTLNQDTTVKL